MPPWDEKRRLVFWRDNQVTNCGTSDFCQWGRLMRWQGEILFCQLIFFHRGWGGDGWKKMETITEKEGGETFACFFFFLFFFFRVLFCFVCFRSLLEISQTENGIVLTEEIKESKLLVSPLVILLTVLCVRLCCSVTACVLSLSLTLSVCLAFSACLCLYNCVAVCVCVCLCVRVCGCLWFIHVQRLPCSVSVYARLECLHQCSHTVLCLTLAFVCFSLESLSGRIAIIGHYVYVASKRRQ